MSTSTPPPPPRRGGATLDLDPAHVRRRARQIRRFLSVFSVLLLLGGLGLLAYPFATNLYQDRVQEHLGQQFATPQAKQAYQQNKVVEGGALTRIKIPNIGVNAVVVQGVTPSALRAGAGHYPDTPLPCETGNVSIAGHRTTYGKPFADLDRLKPGDTIELDTPVGGCVYQVAKAPFVVDKAELSVLNPLPGRMLTLTTCHPKGSAAQRLIIRAQYVRDLQKA